MFNSTRRLLNPAVLLALAVSATSTVAKCQTPESKNLGWAQKFLSTFYPDMKGHRYVMTATTSQQFDVPLWPMDNLKIQIGDFAPGTVLGAVTCTNGIATQGSPNEIKEQEPSKEMKCSPVLPKQFINAVFIFTKTGHLETFASEGPAVGKEEEYNRFKETVRSHSEWTDAQANSVLLQTGASYGSDAKEELLKTLPLDQLEKLFGNIVVVSSEFESLAGDHPPRLALFRWKVTIKVRFSEGTEESYKMYFEPFKGALVEMEAVRNGLPE